MSIDNKNEKHNFPDINMIIRSLNIILFKYTLFIISIVLFLPVIFNICYYKYIYIYIYIYIYKGYSLIKRYL